ncbi:MAG: hypothetical protein RL385_5652 [Pseudomonadota bacterium]|jgi:hypothetical protein
MTLGPGIRVHRADTVDGVFDMLLPRPLPSRVFEMYEPVFRGVGRSDYRLVPSALREEVWKIGGDEPWFADLGSINLFIKACDRAGLAVPGDSTLFREALEEHLADRTSHEGEFWPPEDVWPVLAAAQHHGLPTRLLDWTREALTALYFAVRVALKERSFAGDMAVWVLDAVSLHKYDAPETRVRKVVVPGTASAYLAAQSGLFTVVQQRFQRRREGSHPPTPNLDEFLGDAHPRCLHVVLVPQRLAPKLLDALQQFGVSGATLFPGLTGAADAAYDEMRKDAMEGEILEADEKLAAATRD